MKKQLQQVRDKVDYEGFEYAFINYSSWDEVKDKKFQELKKAYKDAHFALEKYLMENTKGE